MKFFFYIPLILGYEICFSQDTIFAYKGPEITLTIPIIQDFKQTDSVVAFSGFADGNSVFTVNYHRRLFTDFILAESNYIKRPFNYFTITISTIDTNMSGFYKKSHDVYTEAYYTTYHRYAPKIKIASTNATQLLDRIKFRRTEIIMFDQNKKYFTSGFVYAIYKNYEIEIQYLALNEKSSSEINKMLRQLKIN